MATPDFDPPPAYSVTSPGAPDPASDFPDYPFPTNFDIGGKPTNGLLVEIPQIKGHLALLDAFSNLKAEVEAASLPDIPNIPADYERKWAWFVGLAAERFDLWCQALRTDMLQLQPLEDVLPPLDILMVWHSYMLNPRWYAEDAQRIPACKPLFELGKLFAKDLHRLPEILDAAPTEARLVAFNEHVGLPFSPFESAKVTVNKTIKCPLCRDDFVVPYMSPLQTGYLQQSFSVRCPRDGCGNIWKDYLCSRKLAENLSRSGDGPYSFLPGTYFTDTPAASRKAGQKLVSSVRKQFKALEKNDMEPTVNEELCVAILRDSVFASPHELRAKLGKDALTSRIMSAHLTPMIYSVELPGAVLRQGTFIKKMASLGWTTRRFSASPEGELCLKHALARYHAFLDLMTSARGSFFVPTLDIDLVWHTHQLLSVKYRTDCMTYVGRFVDHDDKVDGVKLSSSFDITYRAWEHRFHLPYTHCGCPPPGETFTHRLSHLISSRHPVHPPHLVPPTEKPDLSGATHASDHNSVQFPSRNKPTFDRAVAHHKAHLERQERRTKREHEHHEKEHHFCGFGSPFLLPVPLYYDQPIGIGGCTDADSGLVNHGGLCGNGNGICAGGGCSSGGCGSGWSGWSGWSGGTGGGSCSSGWCGGGCGGGGCGGCC